MKKGKKKHELSALVITGILKSDSTLEYHQNIFCKWSKNLAEGQEQYKVLPSRAKASSRLNILWYFS